jgi:hypothetical protein
LSTTGDAAGALSILWAIDGVLVSEGTGSRGAVGIHAPTSISEFAAQQFWEYRAFHIAARCGPRQGSLLERAQRVALVRDVTTGKIDG